MSGVVGGQVLRILLEELEDRPFGQIAAAFVTIDPPHELAVLHHQHARYIIFGRDPIIAQLLRRLPAVEQDIVPLPADEAQRLVLAAIIHCAVIEDAALRATGQADLGAARRTEIVGQAIVAQGDGNALAAGATSENGLWGSGGGGHDGAHDQADGHFRRCTLEKSKYKIALIL